MKKNISLLYLCLLLVQVHAQDCWRTIAAGLEHTVAIKADGTLWTWGSNYASQLGLGTTSIYEEPSLLSSDTDWASISAGTLYTLAIKTDGSLWAVGANGSGACGDGTWDFIPKLKRIGQDNDWQTAVCGQSHSVALKTDGTLWAWGHRVDEQLGIDKKAIHQIGKDNNWKTVCSWGCGVLVALKTDGTLWGLGGDDFIGDNFNSYIYKNGERIVEPLQVGTDNDWKYLATSPFSCHALIIKNNGTLWAWGSNTNGQLGIGTDGEYRHPQITQVGTDSDWLEVSAGGEYSLGLKTDGTLWSWGHNRVAGQLGDGTFVNRNVPMPVKESGTWTHVFAGYRHALGIKPDGSVWAWGHINSRVQDHTEGQKRDPSVCLMAEVNLPCVASFVKTNPLNNSDWNLYPNPTDGVFTLDIPNPDWQPAQVYLINSVGQVILSQAIQTEQTQLNITELPNGLYFVRLRTPNGELTKSIILSR